MADPQPVESYVVHLLGSGDSNPFKHFRKRAAAAAYGGERALSGEVDRADIYRVPGEIDARKAIAAVKMGAAELLDSRGPRASEAELSAAKTREWDRAVKEGPEAVLKFLGLI